MQTAENMVKKGDPIHKYSLVAYETRDKKGLNRYLCWHSQISNWNVDSSENSAISHRTRVNIVPLLPPALYNTCLEAAISVQ
jgi:hypothetical protein